jgi:hypothetical protein
VLAVRPAECALLAAAIDGWLHVERIVSDAEGDPVMEQRHRVLMAEFAAGLSELAGAA